MDYMPSDFPEDGALTEIDLASFAHALILLYCCLCDFAANSQSSDQRLLFQSLQETCFARRRALNSRHSPCGLWMPPRSQCLVEKETPARNGRHQKQIRFGIG